MRCWLCQWLIAHRLDDGAELPLWARDHLEQCRPCLARYQAERRLIARLTASASATRTEPPPFLRTRILAQVASANATTATSAKGRAWSRALGVMGGALILALLLVLTRWNSPSGGTGTAAFPDSGAPLHAALSELAGPQNVVAMGMRLDAPLQGEWDRVMGDARTALAALSRSFLPSDSAARSP